MWLAITQKLITEFILDFFYFPIWWFSKGLLQILNKAYDSIMSTNKRLAPFLWFKNLFVPMYGQIDFQGRLASVFIRFSNGIVRSVLLLFFMWFVAFLVIFWIVFPFFTIYFFLNSLGFFV